MHHVFIMPQLFIIIRTINPDGVRFEVKKTHNYSPARHFLNIQKKPTANDILFFFFLNGIGGKSLWIERYIQN